MYNFKGSIRRELEKIRGSQDPNKEVLLRYYQHSVAESLSPARVHKRISRTRRLSEMLGKRFEEATKDDMVRLVSEIEQRDVTQWTKYDYKVILRQFYRWLRGCERGETPKEVRWIKTGRRMVSTVTKTDLLTVEEVNMMIESAAELQVKAFISVLFDSGRRLGEILGLRVGDVAFDELGAVLHVDGKVGPTTCASAHPLQDSQPGSTIIQAGPTRSRLFGY